jgi:TetR/AcrR family transcriptional repressor of nem operon
MREENEVPEVLTHKQRTRARILDEAAKALREHGHDGIGVAQLMKRAGLTHGGFYAHFKDRDDLVAEAVGRMFQDSEAMVARYRRAGDPRASLTGLIDYYLSDKHCAALSTGCPVAALSSDAPRLPPVARDRFKQGVQDFRAAVWEFVDKLGLADSAALASSVVAEMVGALTLARTMTEKAEASDVLKRSREQLKRRLSLT